MNSAAGEYWIRDRELRVLGPVRLAVLRDLVVAGRLRDVAGISLDGRTFSALADFPGLVDLVASPHPSPSDQAAQDQAQARELRSHLERLRGLPDQEVCKVPETSSAQVFLSAFFLLVKKFHPERVPDGFPELRAACAEAVQFITERINTRLRTSNARPPPQRAPFDGSQFVGLERKELGRYEATVRVTRQSVSMFTQNALVNLSNSGIFLPGRLAPLGSQVDLSLNFVDPTRTVTTTGRVVWQNTRDTRV
ncbi:MAG: hypothetical protein ACYC8T_16795, partial [Myxococcaceae bacterium]